MKCGALILAAGGSTRLGQPKQLVRLHGEALLERAIRIARSADCEPIVIVLGASEDLIRSECALRGVSIVSNPDWHEGVGRSLSLGVRALQDVDGLLVLTCDMPSVTAEHLRALALSGHVTGSAYAGRKGVPAYFPASAFSKLAEMTGDAGAKELLRSADAVDLPGGELDIDTPEDLARAADWLS
jgi:molybdenum cofactor cytidylyltransferase